MPNTVSSDLSAAAGSATIDRPAQGGHPHTGVLKFGHGAGFLQTLRERVDAYFQQSGLSKRDVPQMYVKSALILAWCVTSWIVLVFYVESIWAACLASVSLGCSMAAVGFNIQHDGSHAAFSSRRWVNSLMAMTLDVLGGSSYYWKKTHNLVHHSFTNITGHDGDIDLGSLARLSPHQTHRWFHRWQHLYMWFLYGFVAIKWQFHDDVFGYFRRQIGHYQIPRPVGRELALFIGGKLLFLTLAFVIPMSLHPWYAVLGFYFIASFAQGVLLSTVFQLAHCLEEAEFPLPNSNTGRMENDWAVHQVQTTVDCARHNRLLTWFTGGLNYQVEHHLFPQICHVHYPAISRLVEDTCREFGLRYRCNETIADAIRSHYRWLYQMGRKADIPAHSSVDHGDIAVLKGGIS